MPERTAPPAETLLDLLQQQAERFGDRVAFRYCPDGDDEQARLTYRDLDRKARAIAAGLQQHGAAGERVLMLCRPGLDSVAGFFGCFYAGAVAVPVDEHWPSQRATAVIPDARAGLALATVETRARVQTTVDGLVDGRPPRWCSLDEPDADADNWVMPRVAKDATAVLQYTSGSTGSPKGVVLTHSNYLHNLATIAAAWNLGFDQPLPDTGIVGVSWLPSFHDLGFVGGVLAPLYVGGTAVLLSRGAFLMRPIRWLEAISKYRAAISAAPNLGYHLCVQRSSAEERAALDLSCWSVAVNGGDPVNPATLQGFAEAFAPAGFRREAFLPAYGLAEATLAVTGGSDAPVPVIAHLDRAALGQDQVADAAQDDPGAVALVSCGRPGAGQRIAIVDPDTRVECPPGAVGEIWVAGPSVAQGYWRRPQETERAFAATLSEAPHDTEAGPFLRTGDRGFLRGGELFIAGRCQDLITVDGSHYYPNDIEQTVQGCDPMLLEGRGAVFAVEPGWKMPERLVVVQEVHRHHVDDAGLAGVIEAIRAAIGEHHKIDAHAVVLVKPMRIPTTTSGKIQRGACRQRFLKRDLDAVAQWQAAPSQDSQRPDKKQVLARLVGGMLVRHYWNPPNTEA